jgi:NADPH:quinone reductase-like Zn-dependent oxidoreductase
VLITAGSSDKIRRCRELGADAGIDYKTEEFAQRAAALSERGGIDVALDCIGGSYLEQHLRVLLPKGRLVVIGLMGGAKADANLALLVGKRLRVIGSVLRSRPLEEKIAITREFRKRIWPLFASEKMQAVIDSRYPLAQAAAAHDHVAANKNFGKVVLTLDP